MFFSKDDVVVCCCPTAQYSRNAAHAACSCFLIDSSKLNCRPSFKGVDKYRHSQHTDGSNCCKNARNAWPTLSSTSGTAITARRRLSVIFFIQKNLLFVFRWQSRGGQWGCSLQHNKVRGRRFENRMGLASPAHTNSSSNPKPKAGVTKHLL